jgi:PASTA domain
MQYSTQPGISPSPGIAVDGHRQLAEDRLGLTNVKLSSANPKYTFVLQPANWTVVSTEPAAGTQVQADDPVVVKVTKP